MDEKLTPADIIRRGIDAVADAENKGIQVEKDETTSFTLNVEDDAVEFASFSIEDTRDTTPGSKAGTRLPTVALPTAKVLEEPVEQPTMVIPAVKEADASPAAPASTGRRRHSKTWERNHVAATAGSEEKTTEEAVKAEPKERTQEDILAEILADTPEERRRKEAAKEEGRKMAEGIFAETPETPYVSEPTKAYNAREVSQLAALDMFDEQSRQERRRKMKEANRADAASRDIYSHSKPEEAEAAIQNAPAGRQKSAQQTSGSYFGVNTPARKRGFKEEATAAAAGGRVIESRNLAVDPTTLSKKELREYNRIAKKGAKEEERLKKKAGKKRMRVWQKVLIILLALILLVVSLGAIYFNHYYGLLGTLDIKGDNPIAKISKSEQSEVNQETMNIMLVGLDSRKDNYTGRSDSMILCTVNKSSKKFVMTSFLRDSYVSIPGHGKDKLNAAYAYGGSSLLTQTIYENYGIVIDRTAVFNFIFVIDVIDYLGGVTVEVTEEELPYLNMYIHDQNEELYKSATPNKGQITSGPGTYTLTGNQALAYARIRYVGTDFARSERQRIVLQECLDKAQKLSAGELNKMATTFLPRIKTDLTQSDCASLILTLLRSGSYQTGSMAIPIDGTWADAQVGDQDVLKIKDFEANTEAWEKFVS